MIREKLEMRRKKYALKKRIKLASASFAILLTLGIICRMTVPKTDALFRYKISRSEEDKLTVTTDVYEINFGNIVIEENNSSVLGGVYNNAE